MLGILYGILNQNHANLVFCLLVSIPLSYLLSLIGNKYLLLAISITGSYTMQSFLFPTEKYYLWGQQAIIYILLLIIPRAKVGLVIFIETFLYLGLVQVRRLYISYGVNQNDITGILMMQTFLYISLGYNYQNGLKDDAQLDQGQIARRIINKPDIPTYVGYVQFLPACLVGPVFEFKDFQNYLNRRQDYTNIPSTISAMIYQIGVFIASVTTYFITSPYGNLEYLVTDQYQQENYLNKIIWVFILIIHIEFKYIAAWSLGMVSMKASGITYRKIKNQKNQIIDNFDRVQVTEIISFQFDPSFQVKARTWNMSVQLALRRYVYQSVFPPKLIVTGKQRKKYQQKAQLATLLTSAFWHGIYPGYYLTFIHWMFPLQISQEIFRLRKKSEFINNLWVKYKFMIPIETILSNFCISYFGLFFHFMTLDRIYKFLSSTYFIPSITVIIANILIVRLGIFEGKSKNKELKQRSKEVKQQ